MSDHTLCTAGSPSDAPNKIYMEHQPLLITTSNGIYRFDVEQKNLIKEATGKCEALGCGGGPEFCVNGIH